MANITAAFTTILSSMVLIFAILVFKFMKRRYKFFYQPKCYLDASWAPKEGTRRFWWFWATLDYKEWKLIRAAGIDAVIYLRFLKYSCVLFTVIGTISVIILSPVNYVSGKNKPDNNTIILDITGIDTLSFAHVPQKSSYMWFHLSTVVLYSFLVYYYTHKLWMSNIFIEKVNPSHREAQSRTVMITHLPHYITSEETLRQFFGELFGNDRIVSTHLLPDVSELVVITKLRDQFFASWKRAVDLWKEKKTKKRPTHKLGFLGLFGPTVDSINYYGEEMEWLDEEIKRLQHSKLKMTKTGFVTLKSVAQAMECSQTLLTADLDCKANLAPHPSDINWTRLSMNKSEIHLRSVLVYTLLAVLFLFWSIPITFIQAFSSLDTLRKVKIFSFIGDLADESFLIKGALENILPSLALNVFLVLLPLIIKFISQRQKFLLKTKYDRFVMRTLYLFLVLNVLMVAVVAGSYFEVFNAIVDHPGVITDLLASALPKRALYLHNYMIFEGYVGYSLFFLCRFDDFLIYKVKLFFAKTEAEKKEAIKPIPFDFAVQYARELFVFTIALIYSCVTPLTVPFCASYFALAFFTAKYNFVFVHNPPYVGLDATRMVIERVFIAHVIFLLFMVGLFTFKEFAPGVIGSLIMFAATIIYRWYARKRYRYHSKFLPLSECPVMPEQTAEEVKELDQMYLHPVLRSYEFNPQQYQVRHSKSRGFVTLDEIPKTPSDYSTISPQSNGNGSHLKQEEIHPIPLEIPPSEEPSMETKVEIVKV